MQKTGMNQANKPFSRYALYAAAFAGVSFLAFSVNASESMLWADIPEISVENGSVVYSEPSSAVRTLIQNDLSARPAAPPSVRAPAMSSAPMRQTQQYVPVAPVATQPNAGRSYPTGQTQSPRLAVDAAAPKQQMGATSAPAARAPQAAAVQSAPDVTLQVTEVETITTVPAAQPIAQTAAPRNGASHLASLVRSGLQRSPSLVYSTENQNLMRALYDEQVASTGPQVSAYGNITGDYDTSSQKSSRFTNTTRAEAGLRTNYTLYDFGVSQNRTAASQYNVDRAGAELAEQKQATAFEIAGTYLELVRQREMLDIEKFRMDEHKHFLNVMETAYNAGQVQVSQIYLARTGITQREQAHLTVERQLNQVKFALERLSGTVDVNAAQIPPAPALNNMASQGSFVDAGLARAPRLDAYKAALKAAELEIAAVDSTRYGGVNAKLDVGADRVIRARDDAQVSTTASLEYAAPLYTHGGTDARIAAARARKAMTQAELDNATNTLREQLQDAYYTLRHADEVERLAMREAAEGEQILNAFKGEIIYGTRPYSDISAQIDSIAAARGRAVSARISKVLAGYAVLRFQNQLAEHFQ